MNQKYFIDAWREIAALQRLPFKVKNMQKNSTTTTTTTTTNNNNNNSNENYGLYGAYLS